MKNGNIYDLNRRAKTAPLYTCDLRSKRLTRVPCFPASRRPFAPVFTRPDPTTFGKDGDTRREADTEELRDLTFGGFILFSRSVLGRLSSYFIAKNRTYTGRTQFS